MKYRRWATYLIDAAVGLSCLVIVAILFVLIGAHGNLSTIHINIGHPILVLLGGMTPFFLAGLIRAASPGIHSWLRGIAIALGAATPVLAITLLLFHTARYPMLWLFTLLTAVVAIGGAKTRSLWKSMHRSAAFAVLLSSLFLVAASGESALHLDKTSNGYHEVHKIAPPAEFTLLDGHTISEASLKGQVVVLDFWGTWCAPCIEELPKLDHIYSRYEGNPKVTFLAVNSELNGDTADGIRTFVRSSHLHMPVALDSNGAAIQSFEVNSFPTLLVIDSHGVIRVQASVEDKPNEDRMTEEIAHLIQEK
jgi:thiol-disulfide isomerase/thioredoxin